MASEREARRKRIMERGSDRLAFITGQLSSLPKQSTSSLQLLSSQQEKQPQVLGNGNENMIMANFSSKGLEINWSLDKY
ncbi:hypothetical protein AMTR_s00146p00023310 [Amborella trichopoda]|uniref:Uncharacterized protein n=1 Tax=Amborella trichopoda TaxID=13333 RepID=W1PB35_AMBTC|nr:hypothetical protein AMTR_s00146p00023310 [Amborella trichopoda]